MMDITREYKYTVGIRCCVYNQAAYVRDCLEGIVSQKTNFKFKAVVHDDASTDNSASIILEYAEKYPDIIIPIIEEENQYSKNDDSLSRIMHENTHDSKYIAYCEGDDYWTDPYKLQKQVDFLEKHLDYGLCYAKASCYTQSMQSFSKKPTGGPYTSFENLLKKNTIPTVTVLFRSCLYNQYMKEGHDILQKWEMLGDYPRWLWFAFNSKIHFMDEIFAVYRVLSESASHSANLEKNIKFLIEVDNIAHYFATIYNRLDLYDSDILNHRLYNTVVGLGYLSKEKQYFQKIIKPTAKERIKHYLCAIPSLYKLIWKQSPR